MATNVSNSQPTLAFPSVDSKQVVVRLKDGREYTGTLISYDSYYNLRLKNCTEKSREGKCALSSLKDMFIRCTSVHLVYTTSPRTNSV